MSIADKKEGWRQDRLRSINYVDARIQKAWMARTLRLCDEYVKEYWVCREEAGMAVVFKCKPEHTAMEKCMADMTRDKVAYGRFRENWLRVFEEKREELVKRAAKATRKE